MPLKWRGQLSNLNRLSYGFVYNRFPFKYREEFRQYERKARENKRGLWKGGIKL